MNKKILIMRGLPGSGKSTYSQELMKKEPNKWKRINKDLFRIMFDNGLWNDKNEKFILKMRDHIVFESLVGGWNVILDDCNFAPKHLEAMKKIVETIHGFKLSDTSYPDVTIEIKEFDTPVEECIKRDLARQNSVGSKVIYQMYNQYLKPKKVVQDIRAPHAIIVDIDGTLAQNATHRSFYEWDKVNLDIPNEPIVNIVKEMSKKMMIIIVSGRDGGCYGVTRLWLEDKKIPFDLLILRKEKDNRSDEIVKEEIFHNFIEGKYYIESVIDDRPKVCRMWRNIGLNVLQVGDPYIEF